MNVRLKLDSTQQVCLFSDNEGHETTLLIYTNINMLYN